MRPSMKLMQLIFSDGVAMYEHRMKHHPREIERQRDGGRARMVASIVALAVQVRCSNQGPLDGLSRGGLGRVEYMP